MNKTRTTAMKISDMPERSRERLASLGIDFSDFKDCYLLPGLTDVHVHLREPGFSYKETIKSGTMAAAAGGFTDVCAMPNLSPCPDSIENLRPQLEIIRDEAAVRVHPYGAITEGEDGAKLAKLEELAPMVIAFSDDGRGVASRDVMREAMRQAQRLGKLIVAHCEDENYPRESSESEWRQLERDIELVRETGCSYHVCHISCRESVNLIRRAKAEGLDITCETAPHYLLLCSEDVEDDGRFKMNPPIKARDDMEALLEALCDGTIDMIATDHAPHSAAEKSGGFAGSAYGIVGLETALPVLYTGLVRSGVVTMDKLLSLLCDNPRRRFGLPRAEDSMLRDNLDAGSGMHWGNADFAIWDLDRSYRIEPGEFCSKGRSTPFEGWDVYGRCLLTVTEGRAVWRAPR